MIYEGAQLIIGCPGRIMDILNMQKLNISNVQIFVLDEADKMLE